MSRALKVGGIAVALLGIVGGLAGWAVGFRTVKAGADPLPVDAGDDLYAGWHALLGRHVSAAGVDYDGLKADEQALRQFAATLAVVGPRSRPDLFPTEHDRLAYYINAYNALTLLGVIEHHPIDTIHDVRGRIEPAPGFGFFWALRFRLDGRGTNLYDLENKVIRPDFDDARIHAAINCASGSCPTLQSVAFRPATLDAQLDAAVQGFVGSDVHVRYDGDVVHLSSIFTWFQGDFEAHARALGLEPDVLAWVEHYTLDPARRESAALARTDGAERRFMDYDWSLNRRP